MKTRMIIFASSIALCFLAACGSGNGSGSTATDSLKTDTAMPAAAADTTMKMDSSMHNKDTSSLPK